MNNQYIRKSQYKKGFISIVLIGVIIALLAMGGYLALSKKTAPATEQPEKIPVVTQPDNSVQAPTNDTVDWKTYTNIEYGFEIKAPASWTQTESKNNDELVYKIQNDKDALSLISIIVPLKSDYKPKTSVLPESKILNGYDSTHYNIKGKDGSIQIYVLNHNNFTLAITLFYPYSSEVISNQILSTFKFTK